ncbi:MAG: hypothetical protein KA538_00395 [Azonexus sp.]|jgi:hypothetical protein|nr:hypothetical protein [Azonexus sp.]
MKLTRLSSSTQRPTQESIERARHVDDERIRRVEVMEGIEGDRQRSLQQELAEVDPAAVGDFHGEDKVMQDARDVAAQLLDMDVGTDSLIKPGMRLDRLIGIDDTA